MHAVTGAGAKQRLELLERFCSSRPDWLALVQEARAGTGPNVRTFQAGCPCCTGRVVLQVALVRALRESAAVRAFVEVPEESHAVDFERALGLPPFERSLEPARRIVLPRDARLRPDDLGPDGQAS